MIDFDIPMGCLVQDMVTNFTGVINGRVEWSSGSIQYSVKPRVGEDGKMTEGYWIDRGQLRRLAGGMEEVNDSIPAFRFSQNDVVRCEASFYVGTIKGRCQWLNNCLTYYVVSNQLENNAKIVGLWIDESDLTLVEGASPIQEQTMARTGGPDGKVQSKYA